MVTVMQAGQAADVARIHESVLSDSIYTWLGRPFLDYYYRRLPSNADFCCHVYTVDGTVAGFLASTSSSESVFWRQMRRDALRLAWVLARILARDPRKLRVLASAGRFLVAEHRTLLPGVEGEILSFAVLPEYRTTGVGTTLFLAAARHLQAKGVRQIKIMTGAGNAASNRFYAKMGCRLADASATIFGHPAVLYHGRLEEIVAQASADPAVAS